ncbi:ComEC/Rec2 family competence protein [Paenibacillus oenotherae]|uniref:ComEC/Rec2 family competence protein n=1 Tax=Paenibacillus oenotherae TaxID=1435645 RepID=A0ABS7D1D1_9BACL|nr:ComEC/Rec2 family competence protein [Paenibacillus oenotherae]MBW7473755.1 ComEC/Rec2 family competence protein [Paenibacillus oenotherae]
MRRPLVIFTVCWVLGSAAAAGLAGSGILLAGGALAAAMLAMAALRRASWPLAAACIAAFGVAAGERMWADAHNATALPELLAAAAAAPEASTGYAVDASGVIASAVEIDGDRVQFKVTAHSVTVKGERSPRSLGGERIIVQVRLAAQPDLAVAAAWQRGDRVRMAGALELPAQATNFGGFDYRRHLRSQRIHWLLKVKGAAAVEASAGPRWSMESLLGRIDSIRASLGSRLDKLYPAGQSGYMRGLVLGMSDDLDPERYRQFSQLGLTHILAVSGLHVAVFLYVLGGALRLVSMTRERMLLVMLAAVPLYVLLAGGSPSIIRAGMMAMLGLAAARMNKLKDGLHLLAAAALIMLAWDPYMLGNVSFQLSFIVTAGLIIGVPPVRSWLPQSRRWKPLFDLIAVTVVAQAVSFPLTITYFNGFNPLSLPANFILVPFISFIVMPLGGASLILAGIWFPAAGLLARVTSAFNELTFGLVTKLSEFQSMQFIWATPPAWWPVYMYAMLAILFGRGRSGEMKDAAAHDAWDYGCPEASRSLFAAEQLTEPLGQGVPSNTRFAPHRGSSARSGSHMWKRWLPAMMTAALILPLLWAYEPDWQNTNAIVSVIDVGQGDSILIRSPSGKHILIDGGGMVMFRKPGEEWRDRRDPFEVGRHVVVPLLRKRGVHVLDLVVISHLDSDHIKGLQAVLRDIPVKRILWNGTMKPSDDAVVLFRAAIDRGIPVYGAFARQSWTVDKDSRIEIVGSSERAVLSAPHADPGARRGSKGFTAADRAERDASPYRPAGELLAEGMPAGPSALPLVPEQNGQSIVMLLYLYNRTFLFTGDADAAQERTLIGRPISIVDRKSVDVLKVAHHGSKTSTTGQWLDYWQPAAAVISVGRSNMYGHPYPDVLRRLQQEQVEILRTDQGGEVQFRISSSGMLHARTKINPDGELQRER